ncbi:DUF4391 domain-containing protein [Mariniflexile sp. AS56]|uniref:DUF4391 domain-containing protein n=1 Tax=Mariniflexile sp. AS56 TaxID=3063957 RepID=UPI0026EDFF5B|nr:DUF4391 domain-containing protein [Mariniflexile sp. AS56]MDO7172615.1 DUF4391 domain-containing protein [Mariniflexile sp. AS56]
MSLNYNNIFKIPDINLSGQKLTKAYFLRNFDLSAGEKKLLNLGIEQMEFIAQIIPQRSNIPAVINEKDSFEQILILLCTVTDSILDSTADNCIQLIQKYISHQVLLIVEDKNDFILNATEKRINQVDKNKLTIERYFTTKKLSKLYKDAVVDAFFNALDFTTLDKTNLELLYKNYIQAIVQFQTTSITGSFQKRTHTRTNEDMATMESIETLENEITTLANQMKKLSQMNEKIQLNIKIHNKRKEIQSLKDALLR